MPYRLSVAVAARIEDALREPNIHITPQYIKRLAVDYKTTARTIYRHKARVLANCPVAPCLGGARPVITWKIEQVIKLLLD
jgi:hypothetical protein